MSRDHKICPDWDFEFIDASSKRHFEILKSLINSPEVDSIVHAGGYHTDGEVMIRIILHVASVKKPILRLAPITSGYDEFAIMMNEGLPSVSCFDFLAEEGFQNMLICD